MSTIPPSLQHRTRAPDDPDAFDSKRYVLSKPAGWRDVAASRGYPRRVATNPDAGGAAVLAADFAQLESELDAVIGLAISAVGGRKAPIALGHWQSGPAWSTMKVPVAIAGLRDRAPAEVTPEMTAAIAESDNAAAESIWRRLGEPAVAARKVDAVLRETGDPTTVQAQRVRPEFTAFGQTDWSLIDQVRFIASAVCDGRNAPIFALMDRVTRGQRWGIGTIAGARFKGGWGPSTSGDHLVRQMGVLICPTGMTAVALAAEPASGSFADGTRDLTEMARWLTAHIAALPAGRCR